MQATPELSRCPLGHGDALLPARSSWTKQAGGRVYPCRSDYEAALLADGRCFSTATDEEVARIQRHWHASGQNGCAFAQWIAKRSSATEWATIVVRSPSAYGIDGELLMRQMTNAVSDPGIEMVSMVFPEITSSIETVVVLHRLAAEMPGFALEEHEPVEGALTLRLRYQLEPGLSAWVMAFGPFEWMPATREAPQFELALRVRPKPSDLFHRLNADPAVAHLADYPADLRVGAWDRLFEFTIAETRRMLECEPNELTAAKTTLAVPSQVYRHYAGVRA